MGLWNRSKSAIDRISRALSRDDLHCRIKEEGQQTPDERSAPSLIDGNSTEEQEETHRKKVTFSWESGQYGHQLRALSGPIEDKEEQGKEVEDEQGEEFQDEDVDDDVKEEQKQEHEKKEVQMKYKENDQTKDEKEQQIEDEKEQTKKDEEEKWKKDEEEQCKKDDEKQWTKDDEKQCKKDEEEQAKKDEEEQAKKDDEEQSKKDGEEQQQKKELLTLDEEDSYPGVVSTTMSELTGPSFSSPSFFSIPDDPIVSFPHKEQETQNKIHHKDEMDGLKEGARSSLLSFDLFEQFEEAFALRVPKLQQEFGHVLREAPAKWMDGETTTTSQTTDDSQKIWFLRAEKYLIDRAAQRYARYWEMRLRLWGPNAFGPITQADALSSSDDMDMLACGYIRPVPGFERVLYLDPSKIVISHTSLNNYYDDDDARNTVIHCALRSAWYVMETCLMRSEDIQYQGAILVVNWTQSGGFFKNPKALQFHQALLSAVIDLMSHVLPIRWSHMCCMLGAPPGLGWAMDLWFHFFLLPPQFRSEWHIIHCGSRKVDQEDDNGEASPKELCEWTDGVELRDLRHSSRDDYYKNWLAEAQLEEERVKEQSKDRSYMMDAIDPNPPTSTVSSKWTLLACISRTGIGRLRPKKPAATTSNEEI